MYENQGVGEEYGTLDEQVTAMKSIMEDVKPVSRLEELYYEKCLERVAADCQDKVGWFTFNERSKEVTFKALRTGFLCGFLPVFIIGFLLSKVTGVVKYVVLGGYGGAVVLLVVYFIACAKYIKQANEEMIDPNKCEDELKCIQDQAKEILTSASSKCKVLHSIYCYPHALSSIVQYLERGRASGIKEAINLYENELNRLSVQERNQLILYFELREVL